jgi:3-hydroxyisobutyrate dehydrogenase-like beta-hydroxyacid dehydrogenase
MEIGFIGIGQMGRHMSRIILEAGYPLTLHDLVKAAAAPLLAKGAKWSDSPAAVAASCQVVFSCLPTPADIEQIVYGARGLMSGWKKGDIYVDMSTNSPSTIRRIAKDAVAKGVAVLDAPVSGGTKGAEEGTLAIMVGGDKASLEAIRPVLNAMGRNIFPVGDAGCGNVAKLANNMISLACNSVTAEGFVLGVRGGVDPKVLWEIVKVSTGNNFTVEQLPKTALSGNFEPGFRVGLAYKDISLAMDLGKEYKLELGVTAAVQHDLRNAMAAGLTDKGVIAVILPLEEAAGIKVRSPQA